MDGLLIDTIPTYAAPMVRAGLDVDHPVSHEYVCSLTGLLGAELKGRLSAGRGQDILRAKDETSGNGALPSPGVTGSQNSAFDASRTLTTVFW